MDQDSIPSETMVKRLVETSDELRASGHAVAAVGAMSAGARVRSGFIRFGFSGHYAVFPLGSERWLQCDMLIASGSLISVDAFQQVGPMEEGFFIDKVDTEWCLRASAKGLKCFGVGEALMEHTLGEASVRAWVFGWRQFAVHRPFRYYFAFRNAVLLARMPHATWKWRWAELLGLAKSLLYFGTIAGSRWSNIKMMMLGLADGLRHRSGQREFGL